MTPITNNMPTGEGIIVTKSRYFSVNPWRLFRSHVARSEIWRLDRLSECPHDLERINKDIYNRIINWEMATQNAFWYKNDRSINTQTLRIRLGHRWRWRAWAAQKVPVSSPSLCPIIWKRCRGSARRALTISANWYWVTHTQCGYEHWRLRNGVGGCAEEEIADMGKRLWKESASEQEYPPERLRGGLASGNIKWPDELDDFREVWNLEKFGIILESPVSGCTNSKRWNYWWRLPRYHNPWACDCSEQPEAWKTSPNRWEWYSGRSVTVQTREEMEELQKSGEKMSVMSNPA
jgi:hypothetical protein